jgi:hypothetical protein
VAQRVLGGLALLPLVGWAGHGIGLAADVADALSAGSDVAETVEGATESVPLLAPPAPISAATHVNLDTSAVVGLVGEGSPVRSTIEGFVAGRQMLLTQTALFEIQRIVYTIGGPLERARFEGLMGDALTIIPDNPSARALGLRITQHLGANDRVIFGIGDYLGLTTITGDARFVRAASAQGVDFDVFLHAPPRLAGL